MDFTKIWHRTYSYVIAIASMENLTFINPEVSHFFGAAYPYIKNQTGQNIPFSC